MTFLVGHKIFKTMRMQVGGHEELVENPWHAALRELEEETGYTSDQQGLFLLQPRYYIPDEGTGDLVLPVNLQPVVHDFNGDSNHRHTDIAYALIANEPPAKTKARGEESVLLFESLREIEGLSESQIMASVKRLALFTMTVALEQWKPVPITDFRIR